MTQSSLKIGVAAACLVAVAACAPDRTPSDEAYNGADTLRIEALTDADRSNANLRGELGCSFTIEGTGTVLLAMGFVGDDTPAEAIVRVAGQVQRLSSDDGGYDDLLDDAEFENAAGYEVEVERTSDEPVGGGESPPYPARISLETPGGDEANADGLWTCGP